MYEYQGYEIGEKELMEFANSHRKKCPAWFDHEVFKEDKMIFKYFVDMKHLSDAGRPLGAFCVTIN